jgi:hypothetical protein
MTNVFASSGFEEVDQEKRYVGGKNGPPGEGSNVE